MIFNFYEKRIKKVHYSSPQSNNVEVITMINGSSTAYTAVNSLVASQISDSRNFVRASLPVNTSIAKAATAENSISTAG